MKKKAEELLKIVNNTKCIELSHDIPVVRELYLKERENTDSLLWTLGAIYQAGKIEGIRQERQRRKIKELRVINKSLA